MKIELKEMKMVKRGDLLTPEYLETLRLNIETLYQAIFNIKADIDEFKKGMLLKSAHLNDMTKKLKKILEKLNIENDITVVKSGEILKSNYLNLIKTNIEKAYFYIKENQK